MTRYIMGDNLIIGSYERMYRPNAFPSFWLWLGRNVKSHKILIPYCVYKSLLDTDGLNSWAKKYVYNNIFDERYHHELNTYLRKVINYIRDHLTMYTSNSKDRWMHGMVNPYVVAIAKAHDCIVITNDENSEHRTFANDTDELMRKLPNSAPKIILNDKQHYGGNIKMLDVTDGLNVPTINLFKLEEQLGLKL